MTDPHTDPKTQASSSLSIASLPMYDWPEQRASHDQFWRALSVKLTNRGIECPSELSRNDDEAYWLNDNLLLGQTCGYPLATALKGKVTYMATPVYDVEGCKGPYYSSAIIVRKNNGVNVGTLEQSRFAFNGPTSLSGYRCVRTLFGEPEQVFKSTFKSGSHRASAKAVASGEADIAAIDAVCWQLLQIHDSEIANQLEVKQWTAMQPSLPFITSLNTSKDDQHQIQKALLKSGPCPALFIKGFELVDMAEYDALALL